MNTRAIRLAGIQMSSTPDKSKNIAKALRLMEVAVSEGAEIIALPQLFSTHWFPAAINAEHLSLAEPEDGETITAMRSAALTHKVSIIAPIFEKDCFGYFNTAFVIGPDGAIIGRYRKMHVPQLPSWEERAYFKPGNMGFGVFKTPLATIGVQLCWDVFFPEGFRALALKGAQIVFALTASAYEHSRPKWERAIQVGAHANGFFVFRVNRVGADGGLEFYGGSFCAGPDGEMLDGPSGALDGVVIANVDLSRIVETRNQWVFLKDRRPLEYTTLSEEPDEA
ncbi:MAG: acyltransferase [Deltaproteobacteria bacterium]|nr:acyltransferase [Deltaproteobacteria bacterium]